MKEMTAAQRAEFNEGQIEALSIALATLVKLQPALIKQHFMLAYPQNAQTWDEMGLAASVTDEYLSGIQNRSDAVSRFASQ